ncbi:hypothetical protein CDL12_27518 [Handroanthus impetiginosus]|uniref:Uncharacterized protein n=1 Tax=Handroanthus impetiginosus TaxID=429701 RepID=A0A2G9G4Z2_9LAMI|nr:hypothetical protein CDL12_27518 [Handroanthus impetiginosus]
MESWGVSEQGWRKGPWTPEEDKLLIEYVRQHGEGRWSCVSKSAARYLPGRTDNEIKNYWRTHFKKRKTSDNQDKRKSHRQTEQQKQEYDPKSTKASSDQAAEAMSDEEKGKKPTEMADQNLENNQFLPMNYQQNCTNWSDYYNIIPVDNYLWGGLWNLDDQNGCSKMANQNYPANVGNHSRGGGYIF